MFPSKLPKAKKRTGRWRSPAHRKHVRDHACASCGSSVNMQFAHLRLGSGAGMGEKPDDWFGTGLCKECHDRQHIKGEATFWAEYEKAKGHDVHALIAFYVRTSPKRQEIEALRRERMAA